MTAVKEEAKKAKEEMEAKNPELKLKHDPTKILPTLKAPCCGQNFQRIPHHHHEVCAHFQVGPALGHGGPAGIHGGPAGVQPAAAHEGPAAGVQGFGRLNRRRPGILMAVRMLTHEANATLFAIHDPQHQTQVQMLNTNRIPNPHPVPRQRQGRFVRTVEIAHRRAGATVVVNENRTAGTDQL